MQSQEFARIYDADMPVTRRYDEFDDMLAPAHEWSHRFGHTLHSYLSGGTADEESGAKLITEYSNWATRELPPLHNHISAAPSSPAKDLAYYALQFHRMNACMLEMWTPITGGKPTAPQEQLGRAQLAKDSLAVRALQLYQVRQPHTTGESGFVYFDKENEGYRATVEGILTEYDAAIVLLNAVKKRPGLTVVPAPAQFERGRQRGKNADFVVVDTAGAAVGVQVKASARPADQQEYCERAIVLVSGKEDLGNQLGKRTSRQSSDLRQVNWAGLISVHAVTTIQPRSASARLAKMNRNHRRRETAHPLIARQMMARQLLGGIKPNLQEATRVVGERVFRKLYEGTDFAGPTT